MTPTPEQEAIIQAAHAKSLPNSIADRLSALGLFKQPAHHGWSMYVEVRKQGAQGIFTDYTCFVMADNEEQAKQFLLDDLEWLELESRFIKAIRRVS